MKSVFAYFLLPAACFLLTMFCVLFSAFVYPLSAQTPMAIKGIVADSITLKTLGYVTLGLKNDKNESVKTGLTNEDGSFTLSVLHPGKYTLNIVAMGYQRKSVIVDLKENTDLFTIYIKPESTSLGGVTVIADKPLVKMDLDKISYDLQADPESKVNSVLEMMRKVPLLSLDHEENIKLKGSGNYRIMINGKPSAMLEKNPTDLLRSMPASTIQSIEVITNPPAKYDGDGLTGIINIVTVKKIDNGYNGSVNMAAAFPRGGPRLGSSFNFKQGKWGISASLGLGLFHDPANPNFNLRTITGENPSELKQYGSREYDSRNAYSNTQISYEIDTLNLISGQFGYNLGAFDLSGSLNSQFNSPLSIPQMYKLSNEHSGHRNGTDVSLNYQLGFKTSKQRLLTFSYRFLRYYDERDIEALLSEKINYNLPDYYQYNEGGSKEQTFQIDYVQPIGKVTAESGIKGIMRDNYSEFFYSAKNSSGDYIIVPQLSNLFDNTQNVFSFYNSWQLKLDNWAIKAGIRLESTGIDADFKSSVTQVKQDYLNLLPSLSVNRTFKDKSSLGLGFSQRIQRPGIWDLNPYVDRSNPELERTGNPALRPVVANNFQLTYSRSKKTTFNTVLSHSYSNNAIQFVILLDQITNINKIIVNNTGINNTSGLNITVAHPLTTRLNANFSTNIYYVFLKGYVDGVPTKNDGVKGSFSLSGGYRFEKGWRINSQVSYELTPEVFLQGEAISIFTYSISTSKDILKDKLSLSASANNPFTKYLSFPTYVRGANYVISNGGRSNFQAFSASLNYKFGKLKDAITKNKRGINNDDVSGGGARP